MSNPTTRPIAEVLDALGLEPELADDDMIAGAVMLLQVVRPDGEEYLSLASSDMMGVFTMIGMLEASRAIALSGWGRHEHE